MIKKFKTKVQEIGGVKSLAKTLEAGTAEPIEQAERTFSVKFTIEADYETARELVRQVNDLVKIITK